MPYVNFFFAKLINKKYQYNCCSKCIKNFTKAKEENLIIQIHLTVIGLLLNQVAMLMEFLFGNTFEQYCDGKFFRYATFVNDF